MNISSAKEPCSKKPCSKELCSALRELYRKLRTQNYILEKMLEDPLCTSEDTQEQSEIVRKTKSYVEELRSFLRIHLKTQHYILKKMLEDPRYSFEDQLKQFQRVYMIAKEWNPHLRNDISNILHARRRSLLARATHKVAKRMRSIVSSTKRRKDANDTSSVSLLKMIR